ncbi:MAG: ABC transporter permease [Clostridiales bacterium]|jgi:oligopeptide transport system permease protein|nr:ABC transporter permease [Clostridiales bacterium]
MEKQPKLAPFSMHLRVDDFLPADESEKERLVVMRESVGFWKDGVRRLTANPIAMVSLGVLLVVFVIAFIVPVFYPYTYEWQIRGSENLFPMQYSQTEKDIMASGGNVFPHILGTDNLGRDFAIRVMIGARISLTVGMVAAALILLVGSVYGAVSGYFGGWVDMIMMRIVDIIYTIPDILIIILLSVTLKAPLKALADSSRSFAWINTFGVGLICIFIVFTMLYWVGMARLVRGQVLQLKEMEYVTAARALGASHWRIISKHLLSNSIGLLIITTTLQIPSSIFTESILSFIGMGVAAPLPSLGSLAKMGLDGLQSYPYRIFIPAVFIAVIILAFNLLGDGLRDAFDPKLKK